MQLPEAPRGMAGLILCACSPGTVPTRILTEASVAPLQPGEGSLASVRRPVTRECAAESSSCGYGER